MSYFSKIFGDKHDKDAEEIALKDYTQFAKTWQYGLALQTSCMAYDPILGYLIIGTKSGEISVHGAPDTLYHAVLPLDPAKPVIQRAVAKVFVCEGQPKFIVMANDRSIHRFTLTKSGILTSSVPPENRLKTITSCTMWMNPSRDEYHLLIGTSAGNIYNLDVDSMTYNEYLLIDQVKAHTKFIKEEDAPVIDSIKVSRRNPNHIALLYGNVVVIYEACRRRILREEELDTKPTHIEWLTDQDILCVAFAPGTVSMFGVTGDIERVHSFRNPFPCTPVTHLHKSTVNGMPLTVFAGGLPKASHSTKNSLTMQIGSGKHSETVFDFPSQVKDVVLVPKRADLKSDDHWSTSFLIIRTQEELLCLDISEKPAKLAPNRLIFSLHFSPITSLLHVSQLSEIAWKRVMLASDQQFSDPKISRKVWPLYYQANNAGTDTESRELLITGHANGSVRIWMGGRVTSKLLLCIDTRPEFEDSCELGVDEESLADSGTGDTGSNASDDCPPFQSVGEYDERDDDHRLAVTKMAFDTENGTVVIGGRGGHVFLYLFQEVEQEYPSPKTLETALPVDNSQMPVVCRTLTGLEVRKKNRNYAAYSYHPTPIYDSVELPLIQMKPCTPITSLALRAGILVVGTAFGFAIIGVKDYTVLHVSCTVEQDHIAAAVDQNSTLGRFKSMRKSISRSIRQSFRRPPRRAAEIAAGESPQRSLGTMSKTNSPSSGSSVVSRPIERRIESRDCASIDHAPWVVRFVSFLTPSFSDDGESVCIGTNGGSMKIFNVRGNEVSPATEIHFKHGAPIIDVRVVSEMAKKGLSSRIFIVSTEQQITYFKLPSLKKGHKIKVTATEGLKVKKATVTSLQNKKNESESRNYLLLFLNSGQVDVVSLHDMHKKARFQVIDNKNVTAISSAEFGANGEVFYLTDGCSQLQRATVSLHSHKWAPFHSVATKWTPEYE